jgi:hypothetical protein
VTASGAIAMSGIGSFFRSKKNRELIAWWGGGVLIVISGLWTAFVYFFPPKSDTGDRKGDVSASSGGIAIGGNVSNSTVSASSKPVGETEPKGK